MSDASDEEKQDKPLDPAVERVQVKLRRLLFGSTFIMLLGFAAVIAAIAYRLNRDSAEDLAFQVPALVTNDNLRSLDYPLPEGARILSTTLHQSNMAITYEVADKGAAILLVDIKSWQVYSVLDLSPR